LFLVLSTSAIDCLERLLFEMTYYVSSGTLNPTYSPPLSDYQYNTYAVVHSRRTFPAGENPVYSWCTVDDVVERRTRCTPTTVTKYQLRYLYKQTSSILI